MARISRPRYVFWGPPGPRMNPSGPEGFLVQFDDRSSGELRQERDRLVESGGLIDEGTSRHQPPAELTQRRDRGIELVVARQAGAAFEAAKAADCSPRRGMTCRCVRGTSKPAMTRPDRATPKADFWASLIARATFIRRAATLSEWERRSRTRRECEERRGRGRARSV